MSVERVFETVASLAPDVRAALPERREYIDEANPSGEEVLAADRRADALFADALGAIDDVGRYASEERDTVRETGSGALSVTCDPLDGSSNLESNNAMGTIVGVYDGPLPARGRDLLAAGYVLYGPITTMTVARENVTEYLVTADGRRELRTPRLPDEPTVFGFGGRRPEWPAAFEAYASEVESELKLRYGGAMVADVNQVVTYGGVFSYPALRSRPDGKLRLQFEGNPIAHVVETAGGASSDGDGSLLDRSAEQLHGRTPVHVGNESLVDRLESHLA